MSTPSPMPLQTSKDDLIVARATPAGAGSLAVVRLDGAGALEAARQMFTPQGKRGPWDEPRRMVMGRWHHPRTGQPIDEGLCVYFASPASYTGNEVVEFHCHGGEVPSRQLINAALEAGARMAQPGEYTRRAFLNGRLDLAQAEAVADLINAQTDAAARVAQAQLAGALSGQIQAVREELLNAAAQIEARLDFPEDEMEDFERQELEAQLRRAEESITKLLETRRRGRLLREGARVALAGRPNAGKSSLLNALARRERAIVTPHPGTTRDTIECTIDLQGVPLTLIDTAGLRESQDPVEQIGIERARQEIAQADLLIVVLDAMVDPGEQRREVEAQTKRQADLVVLNKIDLLAEPAPASEPQMLPVSAMRGDGLAWLEGALVERLMTQGTEGPQELAVNLRHGQLLERAQRSLHATVRSFQQQIPPDLVMIDLRETLDALSEILGLEIGDTILDRIFSQFCLGK